MDKLVNEQLGRFAIEAVGPVVTLPARLVQPVALVLHELATQAQQSIGSANSEDRVQLRWELQQDDEVLAIYWTERGDRISAAPGEALGLRLIKAIVERQLFGSTEISDQRDGLEVNLTIPLHQVAL